MLGLKNRKQFFITIELIEQSCWKSGFVNVFRTFTTWVIFVHCKGLSFCRQGNNLWTKKQQTN